MSASPDLLDPFGNDSERASALAELLEASKAIEQWLEFAANPHSLPDGVRVRLEATIEPGDAPELKLRRWASLFDDELNAVLDARNRLIHGIRLGDAEIRGARWLAQNVLELVQPSSAA